MSTAMDDVFGLYHSTTGRRSFALKNSRQEAEAVGDAELVEEIDRAIEINLEARRQEGLWRKSRNVDESSRQRAAELDNELDRTVGAIHQTLQARRRAYSSDPAIQQRAAEVLEDVFPEGAAAITTLSFEDELSAVRYILGRFNGEWSADLDTLGITQMVEGMSTLADSFEDALSSAQQRTTSWDEVREADKKGQEAMLRVVAAITGRYRTPEQAETRARLLGPIMDQDERIGDLHSRNRRVTDVDPETGEEVIEESEEHVDDQ